MALDVTDSTAVRAAADEARSQFGRIDLAVQCAGTAEVIGPLWESDVEAWWAEVAVHTKGAAARGRGRIVNIYGDLGDRGSAYSSAYACGKSGLVQTPMTRRLGYDDTARRWPPRFSEIPGDRVGAP
jgi:NAD(P)-dependent dehydrogenase (short-subunit alcohol dehydrogenase family)